MVSEMNELSSVCFFDMIGRNTQKNLNPVKAPQHVPSPRIHAAATYEAEAAIAYTIGITTALAKELHSYCISYQYHRYT